MKSNPVFGGPLLGIIACLHLYTASGLAGEVRVSVVVQVGAYRETANAERVVANLKQADFPVFTEPISDAPSDRLIRVMVGPYSTREQAQSIKAALLAQGWDGFIRTYEASQGRVDGTDEVQSQSLVEQHKPNVKVLPTEKAAHEQDRTTPPSEQDMPLPRTVSPTPADDSETVDHGALRPKKSFPQAPEYKELEFAPDPSTVERILPAVPPPATEEPRLSASINVFVRKIVLTGNTAISQDELATIITPYENDLISTETLNELRHKLSRQYFEKGYINSGVTIPDQTVTDGVVYLSVVEGELTEIELSGNERLRPEYVKDRIKLGADKPLNIHSLQESLSLLQQDPLIKQINAQLKPGFQPGESILDVTIKESVPYQVAIGVNNERSPAIGSVQAYISAIHRNVTGRGDAFSTQFAANDEHLVDYALSYAFPLNARGTTFETFYENVESEVVEEPFDLIDIESKFETFKLSLSHPFKRTPRTQLMGSIGFERKHSESTLLGIPFSFSPGVQNGESDVSVIRPSVDWVRRSQNDALALGSTFRIGIDAFGATINDDAPDGEFVTWQGQLQYARRFAFLNSQVVFRSFTQLATSSLLPIEKFSVGGARSVRGYRENQFVRDSGVVASLEVRFPLFADENRSGRYHLQLVPFFDYGRSWDYDDDLPTSKAENISSVGLGFLWDPVPSFHAELFYGYALDQGIKRPGDDDLQDEGIHFLVNYRVF